MEQEPRPLTELATAIDDAVDATVLVIGSAPPVARDLDLLARAPEFDRVGTLLDVLGLVRRRSTWADLSAGPARSVELFRADTWALGRQHGTDGLYDGAEPVAGFRHLARPAPHVRLVLVAHSAILRRGRMSQKARLRAAQAAAGGEETWGAAAALARDLGLSGALTMLRRALDQPQPWTRPRRLGESLRAVAVTPPGARRPVAGALLPRRVRPLLVSLSGPDGSGKSTQAVLLRETLDALGVTTAGAWVPTTSRPPLPAPVRAFADRWRRPAPQTSSPGSAPDRPRATGRAAGTAPDRSRGPVPPHVRLAEHFWIATAAAANAAKLWRSVLRSPGAAVLVLDRFSLDADMKLTYWYELRRGVDIRFERRFFRAIAPTPDVAVLLSVRPETNHERRADEWSLAAFREQHGIYARAAGELGAVVVDGERPAAVVARDIAETVWRRLP